MHNPPTLATAREKKLVGQRMPMSLSDNRTAELWRHFLPRRREIQHYTGTALYSVEVYDDQYFAHFDPTNEFQKWAAVEVTAFAAIPEGLEALTLPVGLYAVFVHQGPASAGRETYRYIFGTWLPESAYALDNRPHFAVMGEKYRNEDQSSEEEIWIPVKLRD
jgi:AraC family transcriptional regulator